MLAEMETKKWKPKVRSELSNSFNGFTSRVKKAQEYISVLEK